MDMKVIDDLQFFKRDTITLAKSLIGKWLVTNINGVEVKAQICETEAYLGINDSACHTYKGKRTERVEPMWQVGGTIYIYLCYCFGGNSGCCAFFYCSSIETLSNQKYRNREDSKSFGCC